MWRQVHREQQREGNCLWRLRLEEGSLSQGKPAASRSGVRQGTAGPGALAGSTALPTHWLGLPTLTLEVFQN